MGITRVLIIKLPNNFLIMSIQITKDRSIGENEPVFIISEIGSNHNRDKELAYKLIDMSVDAGADAVKFQIYSAETLYSRDTPMHSGYDRPLWELIKDIETPREWIPELKEYCDDSNIIFFATPFDFRAVDELDSAEVDLYKIASFELVDLPLIEYTAKKGKPTIISTGLADMEELDDAYRSFKKTGNDKLIFLQCASIYPSVPEIMNLRAMETMGRAFGVPVGLSDHTPGIHISLAAVAMGGSVIEKHVTLDRRMKGPDHAFAIEPNELKNLVRQTREIESAMGSGRKTGPSVKEMEYYEKARRSIHAKTKISCGEVITEDKLIMKRPGYGIRPKYIDFIVGRRAKEEISEDQWITLDMLD